MYIVHMKRVTASEARKHWFRLLDEVADGEVVVIERNGRRIHLRREPEEGRDIPDYADLVRAGADASDAERWGWEWSEESGDLVPVQTDPA